MFAFRLLLAISVFWLGSALAPQPAEAQINLQIGGDPAKIKRALQRQGYTRIEFTGRGFTKFRARACKDGKLWKFKVDSRGKTNAERIIGNCRTRLDAAAVSKRLADAGYRRINIEEQNGAYVAIACLEQSRFRVNVDLFGEIIGERRIGRCFRELTPTDIEAQLKDNGYSRFRWSNRQPPRYVAEACKNDTKYELVINSGGVIRSQREIGLCARPINPRDLPALLAELGYKRVEVTDAELPRYGAIACRGDVKLELVMNRFGKIVDRKELGQCFSPMDRNEIVRFVQNQGFTRVSLVASTPQAFTIAGCYEDRRYEFQLSRYGELRDEKDQGACESKSLFEVVDRFSQRGLDGGVLYLEGCRSGQKVRITLNEFGDQVSRETLGPCHQLDGLYKN